MPTASAESEIAPPPHPRDELKSLAIEADQFFASDDWKNADAPTRQKYLDRSAEVFDDAFTKAESSLDAAEADSFYNSTTAFLQGKMAEHNSRDADEKRRRAAADKSMQVFTERQKVTPEQVSGVVRRSLEVAGGMSAQTRGSGVMKLDSEQGKASIGVQPLDWTPSAEEFWKDRYDLTASESEKKSAKDFARSKGKDSLANDLLYRLAVNSEESRKLAARDFAFSKGADAAGVAAAEQDATIAYRRNAKLAALESTQSSAGNPKGRKLPFRVVRTNGMLNIEPEEGKAEETMLAAERMGLLTSEEAARLIPSGVEMDKEFASRPKAQGGFVTAVKEFGSAILPALGTAAGTAIGAAASKGDVSTAMVGGASGGSAALWLQNKVFGQVDQAQREANARAHPGWAQVGSFVPYLVSMFQKTPPALTTVGKMAQAAKVSLEPGTAAARWESALQSGVAMGRAGFSSGVQQRYVEGNKDVNPIDEGVRSFIAGGAMGILKPAKSMLMAMTGKAVKDAAAVTFAEGLYDLAVHNKPIDFKAIADKAPGTFTAFALQNAVMGVFHKFQSRREMAKIAGKSAAAANTAAAEAAEAQAERFKEGGFTESAIASKALAETHRRAAEQDEKAATEQYWQDVAKAQPVGTGLSDLLGNGVDTHVADEMNREWSPETQDLQTKADELETAAKAAPKGTEGDSQRKAATQARVVADKAAASETGAGMTASKLAREKRAADRKASDEGTDQSPEHLELMQDYDRLIQRHRETSDEEVDLKKRSDARNKASQKPKESEPNNEKAQSVPSVQKADEPVRLPQKEVAPSLENGTVIRSDVYQSEGDMTIIGPGAREGTYEAVTSGGRSLNIDPKHITEVVKTPAPAAPSPSPVTPAAAKAVERPAPAAAPTPQAPAPVVEAKTRLDLMLDGVERTGKELTIEVTDANRDNLTKIIETAEKRGLRASTDGQFVLIRPAVAPAPAAAAPLLPRPIIEALLRSGHEIVPSGPQQAGFRSLVMEKIGKPVPKSKAGVTAVTKALAEYLGVDMNDTVAGVESKMRAKLKDMLATHEAPTPAPAPVTEAAALRAKIIKGATVEVSPVAENAVPPQAITTVATGKPNGTRGIGHYDVIEAGELESLLQREIGDAQTRARKNNKASQEQIEQIRQKPDAALLADSPVALTGAPSIDETAVLAGNGRADGLIQAWNTNPKGVAAYRSGIAPALDRFGLTDKAAGMKQPILVRRITSFENGDRKSFVVESNPKSVGLGENTAERALLDYGVLGKAAHNVVFAENGNLTQDSLRWIGQALEKEQRGLTRNPRGDYDLVEGTKRAQAAMLAGMADKAGIKYGELSELMESDNGKRALSAVLARAGKLAQLDADLSLATPIVEALRAFQTGLAAVKRGEYEDVTEWYRNRHDDMFQKALTPEGERLLDVFAQTLRSARPIADLLSEYIPMAEREQKERDAAAGTASLFGDERKPASAATILDKILPISEDSGSGDLFVGKGGKKGASEARPTEGDAGTDINTQGGIAGTKEDAFNLSGDIGADTVAEAAAKAQAENDAAEAKAKQDKEQGNLFDEDPFAIADTAPATSLPVASVQRAVRVVAERLAGAMPHEVIADGNQYPQRVKEAMHELLARKKWQRENPNKVWSDLSETERNAIVSNHPLPTITDLNRIRGVVVGGKIYINAAAIENPRQAIETFMHEAAGHGGVDALLQAFSEKATTQLDAMLKRLFKDDYAAVQRIYEPHEQVRETLARIMQRVGPEMSAQTRTRWQRVVDWLRNALNKLGVKQWSTNDVMALLRRGVDAVRKQRAVTPEAGAVKMSALDKDEAASQSSKDELTGSPTRITGNGVPAASARSISSANHRTVDGGTEAVRLLTESDPAIYADWNTSGTAARFWSKRLGIPLVSRAAEAKIFALPNGASGTEGRAMWSDKQDVAYKSYMEAVEGNGVGLTHYVSLDSDGSVRVGTARGNIHDVIRKAMVLSHIGTPTEIVGLKESDGLPITKQPFASGDPQDFALRAEFEKMGIIPIEKSDTFEPNGNKVYLAKIEGKFYIFSDADVARNMRRNTVGQPRALDIVTDEVSERAMRLNPDLKAAAEQAKPLTGDIRFSLKDENRDTAEQDRLRPLDKGAEGASVPPAEVLGKVARFFKPITDMLRGVRKSRTIRDLTETNTVDEGTAAAGARQYVAYRVSEILHETFQDRILDQPFVTKVGEVLRDSNIVGGYLDLVNERRALHQQGAQTELTATEKAELTKLDERIAQIESAQDIPALQASVDDSVNVPGLPEAIERYRLATEDEQNAMYNELMALDPSTPRDTRGYRYGARVNLLPTFREAELADMLNIEKPMPDINASNFRNPNIGRDQFARNASYTGEYTSSIENMLLNSYGSRYPKVAKLRFYNKLVEGGHAEWVPKGEQMPKEVNGKPAAPYRAEVPMMAEGKSEHGLRTLAVPRDFVQTLRNIIDTDLHMEQNKVMRFLTYVQILGVADATQHTKSQISVVTKSLTLTGVKSARIPIVGSFVSFVKIRGIVKEILKGGPGIAKELAALSKNSMLRNQHASKPVTAENWPKTADALGKAFPAAAKVASIVKKPFDWIQSKMHENDRAARLIAARAYDKLVASPIFKAIGTLEGKRAFVMEIGEYNAKMMSKWERILRDYGISPFIVAGKAFNRFGVRILFGESGVQSKDITGAMAMRASMLAVPIAYTAAAIIGNMLMTGTMTGRPGTPLGMIDYGPQHDDEKGKRKGFDLFQIIGLRRGLRVTGLNALFSGEGIGGAIEESLAANLHPVSGPGAGFLYESVTGNRFDFRQGYQKVTGARHYDDKGKQYIENARSALEHLNTLGYHAIIGPLVAKPTLKAAGMEMPDAKGYGSEVGGAAMKAPFSAFGYRETDSPAMKKIKEIYNQKMPAMPPTEREAETRVTKAHAKLQASKGDITELRAMVKARTLTQGQAESALARSKMAPIVAATYNFNFAELRKVFDAADATEKKQLKNLMSKKAEAAAEKAGGAEAREIEKYWKENVKPIR